MILLGLVVVAPVSNLNPIGPEVRRQGFLSILLPHPDLRLQPLCLGMRDNPDVNRGEALGGHVLPNPLRQVRGLVNNIVVDVAEMEVP